jgi:hypothetical protein
MIEEDPEPSELYCWAEYCVSYICERISVAETYMFLSARKLPIF